MSPEEFHRFLEERGFRVLVARPSQGLWVVGCPQDLAISRAVAVSHQIRRKAGYAESSFAVWSMSFFETMDAAYQALDAYGK